MKVKKKSVAWRLSAQSVAWQDTLDKCINNHRHPCSEFSNIQLGQLHEDYKRDEFSRHNLGPNMELVEGFLFCLGQNILEHR